VNERDEIDALVDVGFYEGMAHFRSLSVPEGSLTEADLGHEITVDIDGRAFTGYLHAFRKNEDGTIAVTIISP
jgi:hypothetical protein